MVCRAGSDYFGADKPNASWENWSGDVTFSPEKLRVPKHAPPSGVAGTGAPEGPPYITDPSDGLASLVEAVADAADKKQEIWG